MTACQQIRIAGKSGTSDLNQSDEKNGRLQSDAAISQSSEESQHMRSGKKTP
jgi:hypothetical protein